MIKKVIGCGLLAALPILGYAQDNSDFETYFDDAYHLDSKDGNFKMKFGGRSQVHMTHTSQDTEMTDRFGEVNDRAVFRRLRFYNAGTFGNAVDYKLELDFASGAASVTDGYITIKQLPVLGNMRVGHFKEPFSLDMMNSSNDMTFLERAPISAFKKQRNQGLLFFNTALNKRMTWAVGGYQNSNDAGSALNEETYNITGRVTGLPYLNIEKNYFVHLGGAYSYRTPEGGSYKEGSNAESSIGPKYISTGFISKVAYRHMAGAELAIGLNSFSMQAEYIGTLVDGSSLEDGSSGNFSFGGFSVEAAYFLTGEHKNYSAKDGYFKRLAPNKNYNPKSGGFGALELAVRYSEMNLNSNLVNGGFMSNVTAGVNWYLHPSARVSFNYVLANVRSVGNANIFQMKFQVAF